MNITAKSRYALKIMMDLALLEEQGHQQRHNIASRQSIPLDFMDQITSRLRAAGLVQSIRGRSGGFQLSKSTQDISLWDIFHAVEDSLYPVKCLEDEACDLEDSCISMNVWNDVFSVMRNTLAEKTLADSVEKWKHLPIQTPSPGHSKCGTCNRPSTPHLSNHDE